MNRLQKLLARLAELKDQAGALTDSAAEAGRDLTDTEAAKVDELLAEAEGMTPQIERERRLVALGETTASGGNRRSAPQPPATVPMQGDHISAPYQLQDVRNRWEWPTVQAFARAVRDAAGGRVDPRLINAPTTYGAEQSGADGGFAVPPDYRNTIMNLITGEGSWLSQVDAMPTDSNSITIPIDEDPQWGSSSGIRVYTRAEAGTYTASKPKIGQWKTDLTTIYAFVPMTDELLEDAPLLQNMLTVKAAEKIDFKINDLILNGLGGGNPLGILNSPALVSVAKESSQAAATIAQANILKMWSRCAAPQRASAVWLINQDCEPQIHALGQVVSSVSGTAVSGAPMFIPPGGMNAAPNGTLLGRPIVVSEACQTLGTKGDIMLAYLKGYGAAYKSSGLKSDVSMHLYFDTGHTAFRWSFRMGGQPWLSTPITRKNGSNTLSHFVSLDTRG